MRKRFLSCILVLCLSMSLIGASSLCVSAASNGSCGDNTTWVLDDNGTLTISGTGTIESGDGDSPDHWYPYRENIKHVIVKDGVTSVGKEAFRYCNNLLSVKLPDSINSIGGWAFAYCNNLVELNIPNNVTRIDECAFHSCVNLKSIIIPNGITTIKQGTFYNCRSVSSMIIPIGVTSIGDASLSCCYSLTDITIPSSVLKIEEQAFQHNESLNNVKISEGVESIGHSAFENCKALTSITIPSTISYIGANAFNFTLELTDVYYNGTREQWNKISIGNNNENLLKANIHYNTTDDSSSSSASSKQGDYVSLFGELINGRKDYNTNLENLLMNEYGVCDAAFLKDCYLVDMNNDSIPELLCVFCDEWGPDEYAVLVEYDNGFKVGTEIPFNYNSGSAGSEYYCILKANGNFYYEKYYSVRQNYDDPNGWVSRDEIILNTNGEEKVVYSATSNYGINQVNGQQVDEIDYEYVHNNFEIVVDGYNYGESWSGYEPKFGKDYDKFWDDNVITVTLNGKKIIFDQPPIIVDGRTLVPLRAIFEELGATVNWDGNTQTVISTKGQTTISMTIGKKEMYKNGKLIILDVVPQLVGGRTLVPVRAVAEGFDCKVDWDGDNQTVIIKTINTEKVINAAKNLYQANENMGGVATLATYAEVDALLYNSLNEIDKTLAVNEFTLDMVSAGTTATIAAAKVSTGNYSSIDDIGDGLSKLLSSKEIADAADGVLKDAIKQRVFNEISSYVPDANAFILNLGRSAYDRNSKMIQEFIVLHSKFKSGNYTYDDAVAYIVMHDTLVMNRKTMSMAVEVLSDELPQNFLESLLMSAEASAKAVLGGLFGDAFSGRDMNVGAELFTDIITAYTDYACGEGVDFFKYMKQINHPAIDEWVSEVEVYNRNLAQKLNINN